jgi:hypothetical protein
MTTARRERCPVQLPDVRLCATLLSACRRRIGVASFALPQ